MIKKIKVFGETLKNNLFVLRYLWQARKSYIFVNIGISTLNSILNVAQIILLKEFLDSITRGVALYIIIIIIVLYAASIKLHELFYSLVYQFELPKATYAINRRLTKDIIDKAITIDMCCFDNSDFYNKYTLALSETSNRSFEALNSLSSLVYAVISIIGLLSVVLTMDPIVFGLAILLALTSSLFTNKSNKEIYERDIALTPFNRYMNYCKQVFFSRDTAKDLRLYPGIAQYLKTNFSHSMNEAENIYVKKTKKLYTYSTVKTICNCFAEVIIPLAYLSIQCLGGLITVGSVTALWESMKGVAGTFSSLSYVYESMQKTSLYVGNLKYILDYEPKITSPTPYCPIPMKIDTLQFHHVSFRYDSESKYVLRNINITINSFEKIAFVGHNGAGKSTLIKLLLRFYEPTSGSITLNGININDFNLKEYRNLFATMFQDFSLFAAPISVNIFGGSVMNKEERIVVNAMKKAGIYERIIGEPEGIHAQYTKQFDDKGVLLSGGESQKLALSRIFANEKAEIVVLDEPSSALDVESEHHFCESLNKERCNKICLVVSHRLSTTIDSDKIYFIENGEVIEQGSHDELMKFAGRYKYIFELQADKYKGDTAKKMMKELNYE